MLAQIYNFPLCSSAVAEVEHLFSLDFIIILYIHCASSFNFRSLLSPGCVNMFAPTKFSASH